MKTNVGKADRTARIVIGVVILALGFWFKSWLGLIGIVPIFTAAIGWCPAYLPFGINTCKTKKK
jgi:DUF2892 family protein